MKKTRPTALITGASRGIGLAIAETFAENGYDLILTCSKSFDALQENAARLKQKYGITVLPMHKRYGKLHRS